MYDPLKLAVISYLFLFFHLTELNKISTTFLNDSVI